MKEEWLLRGAVVPVDVETTAALVAEIKRLIDVVGEMELMKYGPMAFQIYLPTTPISSVNVNNWKLPWVYDQDRASGNVASMWVTPVAKLGISQRIKK